MESGTKRGWKGFLITHGKFDIQFLNIQVVVTEFIPAIKHDRLSKLQALFHCVGLGEV